MSRIELNTLKKVGTLLREGAYFLLLLKRPAVLILCVLGSACTMAQKDQRRAFHWDNVREIRLELPPENVEGARDLGIRYTSTDTLITLYDRVNQEWLEFSFPAGQFLRKYSVPYLKVPTYRPFSYQFINSQQVLLAVNAGNLQSHTYNHDSTFAIWSIGTDSLRFIEMGNAPVSKTLNLSRDRYFIPFQKKPYIQEQRLFFTLRPFGFAYHLPGFCDTIKYHIGSVDFFNGNFQGYFVESLCREGKLYSGNHEDHFTTPLNDSTILLSTEYSATLFRFSMKLGIITDSSGALPSYFRAKPLQNISPLTKGHELPNNDTSQPRYTEMHRFSPKSFIRSAKFPARLAKRDPLLQKGWNHLIYNEGLNVKATLPFPDNTWGTSITNFKNHFFFRKKDSPDGIIELKMMRLAEGS